MITQGELNVLYAGTMGRAQKLTNVLEAVKIARDRGTRVNVRMVGAGAARAALKEQIDREGLPVDMFGKVPAGELAAHYEWADSALVHLRDWGPLASAIPSKTYELMELGIHISAAVSGETADIIRKLGAGDVVAPEDPGALAELWVELARDRERLIPRFEAAQWVQRERSGESKGKLLALLDQVASAK
ncbi:glycosyltransferase [Corynebacterium qintianiae]|uniref:glycosyltransferase n=1 Tax=Corynebacterium qintianiae TaxID=2709392 RepID=UPI001F27437F|nr:glycosyltransferase [Corynebacterium qintianiae]